MRENFITRIGKLATQVGEVIDQHRASQEETEEHIENEYALAPKRQSKVKYIHWFLPNGGTLILIALLIATQSVWARSSQSTTAASTSTISYQGRLADAGGTPLTGLHNLEFRVYDTPSGGAPLWEELWTGGNAVQVSDGLFNVMLGSLNPSLASAIADQNELYLGITVDTDNEMVPRVQLGSVPFSLQALTVADDSITTAKIADEAVTQAKLGPDIDLEPADNSITTAKIADSSVTSSKLNVDNGLTVSGAITLTETFNGDTSYWADYRSYIRFLKQDGATATNLCPQGGTPVGVTGPKQSLDWATGNDICQNNYNSGQKSCLNVHQVAPCGSINGNNYPYAAESCSTDFSGEWAPFYWWDAESSGSYTHDILGSGIGCYPVKYACCTP
ncbi:MAG: hypothetical protein KDE56_07470 [Anaerolineales bacterium]|nr:hypothetical protein [Anaerolineales bacterium]